jgi:hypothetical protein
VRLPAKIIVNLRFNFFSFNQNQVFVRVLNGGRFRYDLRENVDYSRENFCVDDN